MDAGFDPRAYPITLNASMKLSKPSLRSPSKSYFERNKPTSISFSRVAIRFEFRTNYLAQYLRFDFGRVAASQLCPCQKQPWTNIAILSPCRTISGDPGRFLQFCFGRQPNDLTSRPTIRSGPVFRDFTLRMMMLRLAAENISMDFIEV